MKVLVIPDVHLKSNILLRAMELLREGVAETSVCLMDLPDDWNKQYQIEEYEAVFKSAKEFVKEFPRSLWCYGNHDLSYLWNEMESGFSSMAQYTVQKNLMELNQLLPEDNPIKYVQRIDNVLFCHGGISKYFVEEHVLKSKYDNIDYVVDTINSLGHYDMWMDDSPIWFRPQYYKGMMYKTRKVLQVVGHTPVDRLERVGNVISTDVFSTYRDGSPIGTQEYLLLDTVTWEFKGIR